MGDGGEKFAIGLYLQQRADHSDFAELRIVFECLFGIKATAGRDFDVADDR